MSYFWGGVIVLTLLALAIVWQHFVRMQKQQGQKAQANEAIRQDTNIALYKEHLAELEQDLASGALDQESYDELKEELDRTLIEDSEASEEAAVKTSNGNGFVWAVLSSAFIGLFSIVFYNQHGASDDLIQAPIAINSWEISDKIAEYKSQDPHQQGNVDIVQKLKELRAEVEKNPQNSDAWYYIGQILLEVGEYQAALVAIDKVIEIEGVTADLLAPKAQTLYYLADQKITPPVQAVIDQALALDPLHPGMHVLMGMDAYFNNQFEAAIGHWQKVLSSNREGVNTAALNNAINDARAKLAGGEGAQENNANASQPAAISGPSLKLNVSMSDDVIASLTDDKVVFVYAVAANGGRVPVAAVKLMASDLPLEVTLSDANAMSPAANLSKTERVNLVAVLSMSGQPGAQSGDFKVQVDNLANNHDDVIELVIANQVP